MTSKQKNKRLLYAFFTLLLLFFTIICGRGIIPARADILGYSDVLADLQLSSSFDKTAYFEDANDTSLQIIQIAESSGNNLFVYTYQPCQNSTYLVASKINMSLTDKMSGEVSDSSALNDNDKPKLYDLTLINSSGVFCKYKVDNFTVGNESVRYYNIFSIYREFIEGVDGEKANGNIVDYKAFPVGKLYKVETVDNIVKYSCKLTEVVEIINPFVDFLSYYNGATWGNMFGLEGIEYTDVHYIAFSTNKQIDTLKEVDVTYKTQSYHGYNNVYSYGEKSDDQYKTLTGDMGGSTPDSGFTAQKYSWKCIQRSVDFINSTSLNSDTADIVKNSEFVLVFLTTQYSEKEEWSMMQGHYKIIDGTKVSDVSILRLLFETNGKTYNLGVLMDIQEGDNIPGNQSDIETIGFWAYIWRCIVRLFNGTATLFEQIVAIVAILIAFMIFFVLIPVLSFVFPSFGSIVLSVLKGFWWLICLPFKGIVALVNKIRGD